MIDMTEYPLYNNDGSLNNVTNECWNCHENICVICMKRLLLENDELCFKCPSCRSTISNNVLAAHVGIDFVHSEYTQHMEDVSRTIPIEPEDIEKQLNLIDSINESINDIISDSVVEKSSKSNSSLMMLLRDFIDTISNRCVDQLRLCDREQTITDSYWDRYYARQNYMKYSVLKTCVMDGISIALKLIKGDINDSKLTRDELVEYFVTCNRKFKELFYEYGNSYKISAVGSATRKPEPTLNYSGYKWLDIRHDEDLCRYDIESVLREVEL